MPSELPIEHSTASLTTHRPAAARHCEQPVVLARRVRRIELAIGRGSTERKRADHPAQVLASGQIHDAVLLGGCHDDRIIERQELEETAVKKDLVLICIDPHELGIQRAAMRRHAALPSS